MRIALLTITFFFFSWSLLANVELRISEYLKSSKSRVELDEKLKALRPILFESKFKENQDLEDYLYNLLDESRSLNDVASIQLCRALLSTNMLYGEKLNSSLGLLDKIGNYFESKGDLDVAYSLEASRLIILTKLGLNKRALQSAAICKRLGGKVDLPEMEGNMLLAEAKVYLNMEKLDDAQRLLSEAIEVAKKNNWKATEAKALSLMGEVIQSEGDLESAQTFFQESANVAIQNERLDLLAEAQTQLGIVEFYRGNMEACEELFVKALNNHRKRKAYGMVCQSLYNLGVFNFDNNRLTEAIPYYQEGLKIAMERGLNNEQLDLLTELANLEKRRGNFKEANSYLQRYIDLQNEKRVEDAELEQNFREKWASMQLAELSDEKNKEIESLQKESENAKFIAGTFGFISALLILIGGVLLVRNTRTKKLVKENRSSSISEEKLASSNGEV